jgi:O-antigen/teichoic acid export membrane protein
MYALCQWGMLIALVKLGGPAGAGQYTLALAMCSPPFVFASLQLRGLHATDTGDDYRLQDYLGLRVSTTVLALLAVSCMAIASGNRGTALFIVVAVGCAKGMEAGSDLLFGYLQKHECMERVAASLIFKGLLSIAAVWFGYFVWHNLLAVVCLLCLTWAALLVGFDLVNCIRIRRQRRDHGIEFRPRFDAGRLRSMGALLAPIGFATMLNSLTANVPRYAIEHHAGKHMLGLFGGLCYIQAAAVTLAAAVGQASSPRLARHHGAGNKREFLKLLAPLLGVVGVAGAAASLAAYFGGSKILAVLYTPEYGQYRLELFLLMVAAAVSMQVAVLNDCMLAMRLIRQQAAIFALTLSCTVAACVYAIRPFGLRGAAGAVLASSLIQLLATAGLVSVHLRRPWSRMALP